MFPELNITKGWANHLRYPSSLTPDSTPQTKDPAPPALGSEQGNLLLVFAPHCWSRGPSKALLEFFIWLLVNFYLLRRPRTLIGNKMTLRSWKK